MLAGCTHNGLCGPFLSVGPQTSIYITNYWEYFEKIRPAGVQPRWFYKEFALAEAALALQGLSIYPKEIAFVLQEGVDVILLWTMQTVGEDILVFKTEFRAGGIYCEMEVNRINEGGKAGFRVQLLKKLYSDGTPTMEERIWDLAGLVNTHCGEVLARFAALRERGNI